MAENSVRFPAPSERASVPKIWVTKDEIRAFREGWDAAAQGLSRRERPRYLTYNERAAFKDGWDTRMAARKAAEPSTANERRWI